MIATKTSNTLPTQLQNDNFGFVKLRGKTKEPFETGWQNKPYTYEQIQAWIDKGSNYGVQGGYGSLIIIDADTPEIDEIVKDKLPDTFTVKTPQCGHHYYYICKDIKNKIVLSKDGKHFGEIISPGTQVVGPGSIHPDTGTEYEVVNDVEIIEINKEDIFTNLAEYIPSECIDNSAFNELIEKYGQPYYLKKDILSGINESFWAGLHDAEYIQLYELGEKSFYRYDGSTGLYKDVSVDMIKKEISKRMLDVSRENNINDLEKRRSNATLNNITGHLKGISEKRDAFDRNKRKIVHFANGFWNLKMMKPIRWSFLLNFIQETSHQSYLMKPHNVLVFLNELLYPATTPDDAILIQKYAGLCLLGNNLIQRLLILDGSGWPW